MSEGLETEKTNSPSAEGGDAKEASKEGGLGTDTAFAPVTPKLVRKLVLKAAIGFDCKVARRAAMSVVDWSKKRLTSADTDTEASSFLRVDATSRMLETTTLDRGRL